MSTTLLLAARRLLANAQDRGETTDADTGAEHADWRALREAIKGEQSHPALLPALREAVRALNAEPRFRVGATDSYKIAARCDKAIAAAEAAARCLPAVAMGNLKAIAACHALAKAYAEGGDNGEHPGTVEWSDVDEAHALALDALAEPGTVLIEDAIGTLETLVSSLDEGATARELRNYINLQARAVVDRARKPS